MSQAAPSSDKTGKQAPSKRTPPDERFWQRYSPHAELPLSSAGSLVVHVLVIGLLALLGGLAAWLSTNAKRTLPVEAVQIAGGGGDPHARGPASDSGPQPIEAGQQPDKAPTEDVPPADVPPPRIDIKPEASKPQFDDKRPVIQNPDETNKILENLRSRSASIHEPNGKPSSRGPGKGGTGTGGGSGGGKGKGYGDGVGPGVSTPSQREKRNLRWSMLFNTPNSSNYVDQLRGLGAILAIPVQEDANGTRYQIIRDLSARPPKLLDEDMNNILRMVRWVDDNPDSVRGVMSVLRLKLQPSHFCAFMPPELEQKLLTLELDHLHQRHRGRQEDDIESTKFLIRVRNGKYEPEVKDQKLK